MKKFIFPVLLSFALLYGCGQKKNENTSSGDNKTSNTTTTENNTNSGPLVLSPKEFVKSYNNCQPSDTCAYFKINYLEATSGKIKDKMNAFISKNVIIASTIGDSTPVSIQAAADSFMVSYVDTRKQFPDMPGGWFWEYTLKMYSETSKILCLSGGSATFMGGAHPNSFFGYYNFNKETGDTISLKDILVPGFEAGLNALIDRKYRKMKGLAPEDNLMEKGNLFENKITFTYNIGIDSMGNLEFYYNPYEIAPYAVGPISIRIAKGDLGNLINPNGPLAGS